MCIERAKAEVKSIIIGLAEEEPAMLAGIYEAAARAGAHGARISEALAKNGLKEKGVAMVEEAIGQIARTEKPPERGRLEAEKAIAANVTRKLGDRNKRLNGALAAAEQLAQESGGNLSVLARLGQENLAVEVKSLGGQIFQDEVIFHISNIKTLWSSAQSKLSDLQIRVQTLKSEDGQLALISNNIKKIKALKAEEAVLTSKASCDAKKLQKDLVRALQNNAIDINVKPKATAKRSAKPRR
ncbi:hypothetical protein T492DRAFT_848909 [Pavlovales sp. CCMP2436]|nr:hypothetical protein T492DRAFT_848909 [Pavlovales sp. CCMP2436]